MMKIRAGGRVVASVEYSDDIFRISKGLRFSKKFGKGYGLLMKLPAESRINAIVDMLFVFFPIDVVWIDSNKQIVDIKRNVKPFTIYMPKAKALYVLELNSNSTKKLKIGNSLSF